MECKFDYTGQLRLELDQHINQLGKQMIKVDVFSSNMLGIKLASVTGLFLRAPAFEGKRFTVNMWDHLWNSYLELEPLEPLPLAINKTLGCYFLNSEELVSYSSEGWMAFGKA